LQVSAGLGTVNLMDHNPKTKALEVIRRKSSTKWLPPERQRSRFSVEAEFRIVGETDRFDHCVFTVRQALDPARTDDGLRPAVESERFFAPASS